MRAKTVGCVRHSVESKADFSQVGLSLFQLAVLNSHKGRLLLRIESSDSNFFISFLSALQVSEQQLHLTFWWEMQTTETLSGSATVGPVSLQTNAYLFGALAFDCL